MPFYRSTRYALLTSAIGPEWWQAGGAIPDSNCLEHIVNPGIGQLYAGTSVADGNAWTVAVTTAWSGSGVQYAIDIETGRAILGATLTDNGFYSSISWHDCTLFVSGVQHVYYFICTAIELHVYRDTVECTPGSAADPAFGGEIRWRSVYNNPATNNWVNPIPKAAVFDIALDATQRTALYNTMR